MPIHFGTDGWRAVIGDEFTFANVRHVTPAVADYVNQSPRPESTRSTHVTPVNPPPSPALPSTVVVGFDTRFLSDRFAIAVAEIFGRQWPPGNPDPL